MKIHNDLFSSSCKCYTMDYWALHVFHMSNMLQKEHLIFKISGVTIDVYLLTGWVTFLTNFYRGRDNSQTNLELGPRGVRFTAVLDLILPAVPSLTPTVYNLFSDQLIGYVLHMFSITFTNLTVIFSLDFFQLLCFLLTCGSYFANLLVNFVILCCYYAHGLYHRCTDNFIALRNGHFRPMTPISTATFNLPEEYYYASD